MLNSGVEMASLLGTGSILGFLSGVGSMFLRSLSSVCGFTLFGVVGVVIGGLGRKGGDQDIVSGRSNAKCLASMGVAVQVCGGKGLGGGGIFGGSYFDLLSRGLNDTKSNHDISLQPQEKRWLIKTYWVSSCKWQSSSDVTASVAAVDDWARTAPANARSGRKIMLIMITDLDVYWNVVLVIPFGDVVGSIRLQWKIDVGKMHGKSDGEGMD
jgi:hypothetical protein